MKDTMLYKRFLFPAIMLASGAFTLSATDTEAVRDSIQLPLGSLALPLPQKFPPALYDYLDPAVEYGEIITAQTVSECEILGLTDADSSILTYVLYQGLRLGMAVRNSLFTEKGLRISRLSLEKSVDFLIVLDCDGYGYAMTIPSAKVPMEHETEVETTPIIIKTGEIILTPKRLEEAVAAITQSNGCFFADIAHTILTHKLGLTCARGLTLRMTKTDCCILFYTREGSDTTYYSLFKSDGTYIPCAFDATKVNTIWQRHLKRKGRPAPLTLAVPGVTTDSKDAELYAPKTVVTRAPEAATSNQALARFIYKKYDVLPKFYAVDISRGSVIGTPLAESLFPAQRGTLSEILFPLEANASLSFRRWSRDQPNHAGDLLFVNGEKFYYLKKDGRIADPAEYETLLGSSIPVSPAPLFDTAEEPRLTEFLQRCGMMKCLRKTTGESAIE